MTNIPAAAIRIRYLAFVSFLASSSLASPGAAQGVPTGAPHHGGSTGGHAEHHQHSEHGKSATSPRAASPKRNTPSLVLKIPGGAVEAGKATVRFELARGRGVPPLRDQDLDVVHEKKLHLILFDESLREFIHVHPTETSGVWTAEVDFKVNGDYRVWAEGRVKGETEGFAVASKLTVRKGAPAHGRTPDLVPTISATAGLSQVTLEGTGSLVAGKDATLVAKFTRTDKSSPQLTPYLGALAHVVIVPASGSPLLHVHPMEGKSATDLMIHTSFPSPGPYRVWIEFIDAQVHKWVPLAINVAK